MATAEEYRLAQEKCLSCAKHVPDEHLRRTWLELADSYQILLMLDKELAGFGPLIGPRR